MNPAWAVEFYEFDVTPLLRTAAAQPLHVSTAEFDPSSGTAAGSMSEEWSRLVALLHSGVGIEVANGTAFAELWSRESEFPPHLLIEVAAGPSTVSAAGRVCSGNSSCVVSNDGVPGLAHEEWFMVPTGPTRAALASELDDEDLFEADTIGWGDTIGLAERLNYSFLASSLAPPAADFDEALLQDRLERSRLVRNLSTATASLLPNWPSQVDLSLVPGRSEYDRVELAWLPPGYRYAVHGFGAVDTGYGVPAFASATEVLSARADGTLRIAGGSRFPMARYAGGLLDGTFGEVHASWLLVADGSGPIGDVSRIGLARSVAVWPPQRASEITSSFAVADLFAGLSVITDELYLSNPSLINETGLVGGVVGRHTPAAATLIDPTEHLLPAGLSMQPSGRVRILAAVPVTETRLGAETTTSMGDGTSLDAVLLLSEEHRLHTGDVVPRIVLVRASIPIGTSPLDVGEFYRDTWTHAIPLVVGEVGDSLSLAALDVADPRRHLIAFDRAFGEVHVFDRQRRRLDVYRVQDGAWRYGREFSELDAPFWHDRSPGVPEPGRLLSSIDAVAGYLVAVTSDGALSVFSTTENRFTATPDAEFKWTWRSGPRNGSDSYQFADGLGPLTHHRAVPGAGPTLTLPDGTQRRLPGGNHEVAVLWDSILTDLNGNLYPVSTPRISVTYQVEDDVALLRAFDMVVRIRATQKQGEVVPTRENNDRCRGGDDDRDGLVDCEDPDCQAFALCGEFGDLADGHRGQYCYEAGAEVDDDGDGLANCASWMCWSDPACWDGLPDGVTLRSCFDGIDGPEPLARTEYTGFDCADPLCLDRYPQCRPEVDCFDGHDNDLDGATDCNDPDCGQTCLAACELGQLTCADDACRDLLRCIDESVDCADGLDNDRNGLVDCADPVCAGAVPECPLEDCNVEGDEDADGYADCDDFDCALATNCEGQMFEPHSAVSSEAVGERFADEYLELLDVTQFDEDPTAFDHHRLAIAAGKVIDESGEPLANVLVHAPAFPRLGHTFTSSSGLYFFMLNGGGPVNLEFVAGASAVATSYSDATHFPVQRRIVPRWLDFEHLDIVALVQRPDPTTRPVLPLTTDDYQVARGQFETDAAGTRALRLIVPPTTDVVPLELDGWTPDEPALGMEVELVEYTVGEDGLNRMPGTLPPSTAYTYAAEIHTPRLARLGPSGHEWVNVPIGTRVEFRGAPAVAYVEAPFDPDDIDSHVGNAIPAGSFNLASGVWDVEQSGLILRLCGQVDGEAVVQGWPVDRPALADGELQRLSETFSLPSDDTCDTADTVVFRVELTHLTPWDFNGAKGFDDSARPPTSDVRAGYDPEDDPTLACGSVIECENRVIMEMLGLPDVGLDIVYRSDRVAGFMENRRVVVQVDERHWTGTSPENFIVSLEIAGTVTRVVPDANGRAEVYWSGNDGFGRPAYGERVGTVRIGRLFPTFMWTAVEDRDYGFGAVSVMAPGESMIRYDGDEYMYAKYPVVLTGTRSNASLGLGGWIPGNWNYFSAATGRITPPDARPYTVSRGNSDRLAGVPTYDDSTGNLPNHPVALDAMPDGSLLVSEQSWPHTQINVPESVYAPRGQARHAWGIASRARPSGSLTTFGVTHSSSLVSAYMSLAGESDLTLIGGFVVPPTAAGGESQADLFRQELVAGNYCFHESAQIFVGTTCTTDANCGLNETCKPVADMGDIPPIINDQFDIVSDIYDTIFQPWHVDPSPSGGLFPMMAGNCSVATLCTNPLLRTTPLGRFSGFRAMATSPSNGSVYVAGRDQTTGYGYVTEIDSRGVSRPRVDPSICTTGSWSSSRPTECIPEIRDIEVAADGTIYLLISEFGHPRREHVDNLELRGAVVRLPPLTGAPGEVIAGAPTPSGVHDASSTCTDVEVDTGTCPVRTCAFPRRYCDGMPAATTQLFDPVGIEVDAWGGIYIRERSTERIRYIEASGDRDIFALAGPATPVLAAVEQSIGGRFTRVPAPGGISRNGLGTAIHQQTASDIALAGDVLFYHDGPNSVGVLARIEGMGLGPSARLLNEDASLELQFDAQGRQIAAYLPGEVNPILEFEYSSVNNLLIGIHEYRGSEPWTTRFVHTASGVEVVSPDGVRTELTFDPAGGLRKLSSPGQEPVDVYANSLGLVRAIGDSATRKCYDYDSVGYFRGERIEWSPASPPAGFLPDCTATGTSRALLELSHDLDVEAGEVHGIPVPRHRRWTVARPRGPSTTTFLVGQGENSYRMSCVAPLSPAQSALLDAGDTSDPAQLLPAPCAGVEPFHIGDWGSILADRTSSIRSFQLNQSDDRRSVFDGLGGVERLTATDPNLFARQGTLTRESMSCIGPVRPVGSGAADPFECLSAAPGSTVARVQSNLTVSREYCIDRLPGETLNSCFSHGLGRVVNLPIDQSTLDGLRVTMTQLFGDPSLSAIAPVTHVTETERAAGGTHYISRSWRDVGGLKRGLAEMRLDSFGRVTQFDAPGDFGTATSDFEPGLGRLLSSRREGRDGGTLQTAYGWDGTRLLLEHTTATADGAVGVAARMTELDAYRRASGTTAQRAVPASTMFGGGGPEDWLSAPAQIEEVAGDGTGIAGTAEQSSFRRAYNAAGWQESIVVDELTRSEQRFESHYDSRGRVEWVTANLGSGAPGSDLSAVQYIYDDHDRLLATITPRSGAVGAGDVAPRVRVDVVVDEFDRIRTVGPHVDGLSAAEQSAIHAVFPTVQSTFEGADPRTVRLARELQSTGSLARSSIYPRYLGPMLVGYDSVLEGDANVSWSYDVQLDEAGRVAEYTITTGLGGAPTDLSLVAAYPSGGVGLQTQYDATDPTRVTRLGVLSDPDATVEFGWNSEVDLVESFRHGPLLTTYAFDEFGRIERDVTCVAPATATSCSSDIVANNTYRYDPFGRIVEWDRVGAYAGASEDWEYAYDADSGRLASAQYRTSTPTGYTYDVNGNLTHQSTHAVGLGAHTTDAEAALLRPHWARALGANPVQPSEWQADTRFTDRAIKYGPYDVAYDVAGNVRTMAVRDAPADALTLTYDSSGGLLQAATGSAEVRYDVDALGRRVGRHVTGAGSLNGSEFYVYGGHVNPVARLDEFGQVDQLYVYGSRTNVPDLVVEMDGSSVTRTLRLLHDARGSVTAVVDLSAVDPASPGSAIVQTTSYDAYGRLMAQGGVAAGARLHPFGFAGGLHEPVTGLVRFGARDYSPELGRWTARDPIGFWGGDANLYAYVSGDPINGIDPTGAVIESGWDVANIAIGVASLGYNVANGNVGAAALDVAGLTVDAIATAVPGVPGGAATAIRAGRVARGANTAANAAQAADNAADAASCVVNTGRNSVYWNMLRDGTVEYVGITRSFVARRLAHIAKTRFSPNGVRDIELIDGLTQLSR